MRRGRPKRLPPKKPKELDPKITELHNEITGETKWEVFRRGFAREGFMLRQPFSETFDTREEAIACYADNFGWIPVGEFQPDPEDETEDERLAREWTGGGNWLDQ